MTDLAHDDYPEILRDLGDKVADLLIDADLTEREALAVAWDVTEHIRVEWGGSQPYFCKPRRPAPKDAPLPGQQGLFGEVETANQEQADPLPERFEMLRQAAWQALSRHVDDRRAVDLAGGITSLIRADLAGSHLYISKGERYVQGRRNAEIYAAFCSATIDRTCRQHGLTRARIYQILNQEHRRRQRPLPFKDE